MAVVGAELEVSTSYKRVAVHKIRVDNPLEVAFEPVAELALVVLELVAL